MTEPSADIVPAATVVLLRDGPGGPETLLLRRNRRLVFAGGHWVFPGGRLDAADLAGPPPPAVDDAGVAALVADAALAEGARRAAVRETREETSLVLDAGDLVWFAHWTPPADNPRRFATWFYATAAPAGAITVDGGEILDHAWQRPGDALARRDAGEIELSPPTWVTLWQLRSHPSTRAALDALAARPPERFSTRIVAVDDHLVALWDGDAGYADGDPGRPGARHRLVMHPGGWRYQREAPAPAP